MLAPKHMSERSPVLCGHASAGWGCTQTGGAYAVNDGQQDAEREDGALAGQPPQAGEPLCSGIRAHTVPEKPCALVTVHPPTWMHTWRRVWHTAMSCFRLPCQPFRFVTYVAHRMKQVQFSQLFNLRGRRLFELARRRGCPRLHSARGADKDRVRPGVLVEPGHGHER